MEGKSKHKCLLLKGQRQVGKTHIVREFGKTYDHFKEFDFISNPNDKSMFEGSLTAIEVKSGNDETSKSLVKASLFFKDNRIMFRMEMYVMKMAFVPPIFAVAFINDVVLRRLDDGVDKHII